MITLYYAPNSVALAPHIALAQVGLPYRLERVDHQGDKRLSDGRSYYAINPLGYVPALELADGVILTETTAVLEYIADHASDDTLCPAPGNLDRYRVLQWVHFAASELHQKIMRLTLPGVTEEYQRANVAQLHDRLKHIDAALAGRTGLVGDAFTIADIFVFVAVRWWAEIVDLSAFPELSRLIAATRQRPVVAAVLDEQGID